MTEQQVHVVKKMQEEIEFLQQRMLDAYQLKELEQQLQERVTSLVDNNTKLGKVHRQQIQALQDKMQAIEAGYSLLTAEHSATLQDKIGEFLASNEHVQRLIEGGLEQKLGHLQA